MPSWIIDFCLRLTVIVLLSHLNFAHADTPFAGSGGEASCIDNDPNWPTFLSACIANCGVRADQANICHDMYKAKAVEAGCEGAWRDQAVCNTKSVKKSGGTTEIPVGPGPSPGPAPTKPVQPSGPSGNSSSCQQLAQRAIQCCNDPSSCSGGSSGNTFQPAPSSGGINQNCQNMNNAGQSAGNANSAAGQACFQAFTACEESCRAANMQSVVNMCAGLSDKMKTLGGQAVNNLNAANAGQNCNAAASSAQPPGANDPNSQLNNQATNDPYGCNSNPSSQACQNCTLNPNSPTCKALAAAQQNPTGKIGFQAADKTTGGNPNDFNVADNSTVPNGTQIGGGSSDPNAKTDAHVIPNGGGGMPGDGSSKPATLGGSGGRPSAGAPGFNNVADIERGMMSGGYSAPGGSGDTQDSSGFKGYGKNGRDPASATAMDLKKYLPGNALDPSRTLAGFGMHSAEISGKSGDNFKKISQRIQEKCKLGILLDCH